MASSLQSIKVEGSPYWLGYNIGKQTASGIKEAVLPSPTFKALISLRNSNWLTQADSLLREKLPNVREELRGMADGSGVPYRDLLLWNARGDLQPHSLDGCTTLALKRENDCLICHNEDGDPLMKRHWTIVEARPDNAPNFCAFLYPGTLPGNAFGMNEAGLCFSINNIRSLDNPVGLPRIALARAALEQNGVGELQNLLESMPRAGAFHYMAAVRRSRSPISIEATHMAVSIYRPDRASAHANHAIHPSQSQIHQKITASSVQRQMRVDSFVTHAEKEMDLSDLTTILGERDDPRYPLYRTERNDPDGENTLASVGFTISLEHIKMDLRKGPDHPLCYRKQF